MTNNISSAPTTVDLVAVKPDASFAPSSWPLLAILVMVVLLLAIGAYAWMRHSYPEAPNTTLGGIKTLSAAPAAAVASTVAIGAKPHATDMDQFEVMAENLAGKMKDRPQDAEGWAMLARTYGVLGRYPEAIAAYEKAIALRGDDNVLRADYAAARALAGLPPDSRGVAVVLPAARTGASSFLVSTGQTVSGTVLLALALMKQVRPEDTVFIFARPTEGSRMPLALLRKQVKDLPLKFSLDDSMAMSPASRLSLAGPVIVGARVSKSGNPIPEKGDLTGQSGPTTVGSKGLIIEIREVLVQ
jgi:cytochrome c-type biogenesis protein CcmH